MPSVHLCRTILRFNPRTREECDPPDISVLTIHKGFNPRTREECDARMILAMTCTASFNPRTREECDISLIPPRFPAMLFQSTHP